MARKHKYFLHRVDQEEKIYSSPYLDEVIEYIDDEIEVNESSKVEDYYVLDELGRLISISCFNNDGYH